VVQAGYSYPALKTHRAHMEADEGVKQALAGAGHAADRMSAPVRLPPIEVKGGHGIVVAMTEAASIRYACLEYPDCCGLGGS